MVGGGGDYYPMQSKETNSTFNFRTCCPNLADLNHGHEAPSRGPCGVCAGLGGLGGRGPPAGAWGHQATITRERPSIYKLYMKNNHEIIRM